VWRSKNSVVVFVRKKEQKQKSAAFYALESSLIGVLDNSMLMVRDLVVADWLPVAEGG